MELKLETGNEADMILARKILRCEETEAKIWAFMNFVREKVKHGNFEYEETENVVEEIYERLYEDLGEVISADE